MLRLYKLYFSADKVFIRKLKNILGFIPGNTVLYKMAFRHRSVARLLKNGSKSSNERLEFLGDAILGSVIAELLFKSYPYKEEGFLTEMRSKIVNRANLNQLARKMGFDQLIIFDQKMVNMQSKHHSMLGDAFEALIGAIYLDKGYDFTKEFLMKRIVKPYIDIHMLEVTETNFKSKLIEWCQRQGKDFTFDMVDNGAGESAKLFTIHALVDGEVVGIGRDYNKKNAEKLAAEKACEALSI
ncbi:ribonuclease 3 [Pedobacter quisquiliarum]|uniref:Ribonuclease 3 n=1 Tax=Pedobacter quisquiliarum TaxID=1834438 RepID=A0A916U1J6_9SPHI|nr:ribonuclease III [Pedobacter quisquiliarum]GGC57043.1 ribonuclease 3 [Pedobacter quisquiliarum]